MSVGLASTLKLQHLTVSIQTDWRTSACWLLHSLKVCVRVQKLPGSTATSPSPIVGLTSTVLADSGSLLLIVLTAEGALYLYAAQGPDQQPPEVLFSKLGQCPAKRMSGKGGWL